MSTTLAGGADAAPLDRTRPGRTTACSIPEHLRNSARCRQLRATVGRRTLLRCPHATTALPPGCFRNFPRRLAQVSWPIQLAPELVVSEFWAHHLQDGWANNLIRGRYALAGANTMTLGVCARCRRRKNCRLRQPGTWVADCDAFEPQDAATSRSDTPQLAQGPPGSIVSPEAESRPGAEGTARAGSSPRSRRRTN